MAPFAHLHVHSCFSFHDGADAPAALVARAAGLGCRALALTDTNGLYGALPFCTAAKAAKKVERSGLKRNESFGSC